MLEQLPATQWSPATAAHLINRAGFGGSPSDIENLHRMGMNAAVNWFVNYDAIPDPTPAPDWTASEGSAVAQRQVINASADPEARRILQNAYNQARNAQLSDLRYWWMRRMALGPRPFQEKMTLFWHGHFATSFEKVQSPYFLWLQNETLRQNAVGNFNQLLIAVAEDPAMLTYLDGARSNKKKPNENFAREVLELFTLGEGHYTEQDIQQSAKAYTGWGLAKDQIHYEYHRNNHDDGPKTVFGQTGNFTGEDVLNLICAKPECAQFITKKIWRFFVQDEPPQPVIDALAAQFQKSGLDVRHLMSVIFRSKEFYAPDVIRSQIKSPVQWLIASSHQLEAPLPTQPMTLVMLRQLGQELFQPPNVKGWDGGVSWITTNTLLDRYNLAAALIEGQSVPLPSLTGQLRGMMSGTSEYGLMQIAPAAVGTLFTPEQLSNPDSFLTALETRFLNGQIAPQRRGSFVDFLQARAPLQEPDIRKAIRLLMCTPEYQLT